MRNKYSTFPDESLICFEPFKPINIENARVETKTFIMLLSSLIKEDNLEPGVDKAIKAFFKCYDGIPKKIDEVADYAGSVALLGPNPPFDDRATLEKLQRACLNEVGKRRQAVNDVIRKLQEDLFSATMRNDVGAFIKVLEAATTELDEKVNHLHDIIRTTD